MTETLPFGQPLGGIMQVAYVVEDLQQGMRRWIDTLGVGPFFLFEHFQTIDLRYRGKPSNLDVSLALAFSGSMCIELIYQHNDVPSVYREVVATRGYGFHHWAVSTRSIDTDIGRYQAMGAELAMHCTVAVGARAAYMDTLQTLGGMIELIEITPPVEALFSALADASIGWQGQDPIRSFG